MHGEVKKINTGTDNRKNLVYNSVNILVLKFLEKDLLSVTEHHNIIPLLCFRLRKAGVAA